MSPALAGRFPTTAPPGKPLQAGGFLSTTPPGKSPSGISIPDYSSFFEDHTYSDLIIQFTHFLAFWSFLHPTSSSFLPTSFFFFPAEKHYLCFQGRQQNNSPGAGFHRKGLCYEPVSSRAQRKLPLRAALTRIQAPFLCLDGAPAPPVHAPPGPGYGIRD